MDSPETRMKQFRIIYEHLCHTPRFRPHLLSKDLELRPSSVALLIKKAFEEGYIVGPQIREMSFANLWNYMYLVNCDDPIELYEKYVSNKDVVYHEILDGFCNLRVFSKKELDIKGTVLGGLSSDYHIPYAPNQQWGMAIDTMRPMIRKFNPEDYTPMGYIKTHWDQTVKWSKIDEILFWEFKYNLRKPLEPIARQTGIYVSRIKKWLERLPECCTIFTCYYPKSLPAYDPYLYVFETDYEDFIIDLFSKLPTTCWFQRVSDKLIAQLWIDKEPIERTKTRTKDVTALQIPLLIRDMEKEGILKSEAHAIVKCYWRREIDDI